MKNGVKIEKIKYIIDTEKRITICIMQCCIDYDKTLPNVDIFSRMWIQKLPHISRQGSFTVKAIAKCSKGDTFNENIGKKLAESRANLKAFKIAVKFYHVIHSYYASRTYEVFTMQKILAKSVEFEENYLKTLI